MKCILFSFFISGLAFSTEYAVNKDKSTVTWHLYIEKDTNVYGDVPISTGHFSIDGDKNSGVLKFDLGATKSYELDGEEKSFSNARDQRIAHITGAKNNTQEFTIIKINGLNPKGPASEIEVEGNLNLNGVIKEIELKGKLEFVQDGFVFKGSYELPWQEYQVADPIMWFMKMTKKAAPQVVLQFNIEAQKK